MTQRLARSIASAALPRPDSAPYDGGIGKPTSTNHAEPRRSAWGTHAMPVETVRLVTSLVSPDGGLTSRPSERDLP